MSIEEQISAILDGTIECINFEYILEKWIEEITNGTDIFDVNY